MIAVSDLVALAWGLPWGGAPKTPPPVPAAPGALAPLPWIDLDPIRDAVVFLSLALVLCAFLKMLGRLLGPRR